MAGKLAPIVAWNSKGRFPKGGGVFGAFVCGDGCYGCGCFDFETRSKTR